LQLNDFLLKYVDKYLVPQFATLKKEFFVEETDFYKKGKKIDSLASEIIDKIKEELRRNSIFLLTNQKNLDNELISFVVRYEQIFERFTFTLLPTKFEIEDLNNREKIRQQLFEKELSERILELNDKQSVTLINDVLGYEKLSWIKNFKKGKPTRDGGIDFTATICVDKNNAIECDGFGKFFEVYGQLKHLQRKMSESAMRDLIGTMTKSHSKIQYGMVVSSRGFSDDCKKVISEAISSKSNKINAIFCEDINFISKLMIKNKIGLKTNRIKSGLFVDEEWWDEIKTFTT